MIFPAARLRSSKRCASAAFSSGNFEAMRGPRVTAARQVLGLSPRPTALVVANDFQAIGALRVAGKLVIAVPQDLSVTGFDDIQASAFTYPGLTTVAQNTVALGRSAAARVLDALKGKPLPARRLNRPQLIFRESTGPVENTRHSSPWESS